MELLNFYAKILPDKLFVQEQEKRQQAKWIGDAYALLSGTDIAEVNKEGERVKEEIGDYKLCSETGSYSMMLGCHIPVRNQSKQPLVERFLGDDDPITRFQPKREVENMFGPEFGLRQNKMHVDTDDVRTRFSTTTRTNDGVDKGQRIGPGLGRGPNDNSQRGIHPMLRILPKGVNKVRSWLNEKKTYTANVNTGQMGTRAADISHLGNIEKRTADTFTDRTDLTTRVRASTQTNQRVIGKIDDAPTQRALRTDPIMGAAKAYDKHSQNRLDRFTQETVKNEYRSPEPMSATGTVKAHSSIQSSTIILPMTQRSALSASSSITGHASANVNKEVAVNYFDIPRSTIKEQVKPQPVLNVSTIQKGSPQYSVSGFTPNTTARDITAMTSRTGQIRGVSGGHAFNPDVEIRDTLKTPQSVPLPQAHGTTKHTATDFKPLDSLRQISFYDSRMTSGVMNTKEGVRIRDDQELKTTARQTTSDNSFIGTATIGPGTSQYVLSGDFVPRDTIREYTQGLAPISNAAQAFGGSGVVAESIYNRDSSARQSYGSPNAGVAVATNRGDRVVSEGDVPLFTQRDATSENVDRQGHASKGGGPTMVDLSTIQLNECRNEHFSAMENRPITQIGNASFPNKSTVLGNFFYLRPDGDVIQNRATVPLRPIFGFPTC